MGVNRKHWYAVFASEPSTQCVTRHSPGNAKLQGLTTQLHLTGHKYNIALVRFRIVPVPSDYVVMTG